MGLSETKSKSKNPSTAPKAKVAKKPTKRKRGHSLSPVGDEDVSMDAAGMQEAKKMIQESIAAKEMQMDEVQVEEGPKKKQGDHGTGAGIKKGRLVDAEGKEVDYLNMYQKGSKRKV